VGAARMRVGLGYDVHPFGGAGPLILGGVELPGPGLAGHSDADVVAHVAADALLGAAGLPDLGTLFPADDDQWRGVRSIELVRAVAARLVESGWRVVNIDVVVAIEEPRLGPHVAAMCANLVDALGESRADDELMVSVKPKRGEGVGFVGRREGIEAWAVALIERATQ